CWTHRRLRPSDSAFEGAVLSVPRRGVRNGPARLERQRQSTPSGDRAALERVHLRPIAAASAFLGSRRVYRAAAAVACSTRNHAQGPGAGRPGGGRTIKHWAVNRRTIPCSPCKRLNHRNILCLAETCLLTELLPATDGFVSHRFTGLFEDLGSASGKI